MCGRCPAPYGHGMTALRRFWIGEALVSFAALVLVASQLSDQMGEFLLIELVLFAVAFSVAAAVGPGKVLALGVGLAFGVATLLSVFASESCTGEEFICFGPGAMFALGLILSGGLFPAWAFGAGLGALARLTSRADEQPL